MTVGDALAQASTRLRACSDSARLDAELLLAHVLGTSRSGIVAAGREPLDEGAARDYAALLARREQGEPLAYLTGVKGFWRQTLSVSRDVLVPRPETELLVEWALECVSNVRAPAIADLGTGSGCIALALAQERADAAITATDQSPAALAVARDNAQRLGVTNARFVQGDWFAPLAGHRFHVLVSNPPYVASDDPHLDDLRFEPRAALEAGADGLAALRVLAAQAHTYLHPGGWLLLEHGCDQAPAVRSLLRAAGFEDVESRRDLAGHERASGGRWTEG